jgi:cyclophilin family peptidyl-prolyl cis-trans isomerase/HEAT repeat protein
MRQILQTRSVVARKGVVVVAAFLLLISAVRVQPQQRREILHNPTSGDPVSKILLLQILRAEDERRWDDELRKLFSARNANVRSRAALAAGRIGNAAAVPELVRLLEHDDESAVRAMAAFALGEIESASAADVLLAAANTSDDDIVSARSLEALGKIAAAFPKEQEAQAQELAGKIIATFSSAVHRRGVPDRLTVLLGLTALLRAKALPAGPLVAEFLSHADPRIRADAANTLARLKQKDGNEQLRKLLISDPDAIVRANAARVLGATEDQSAFAGLLDRALLDPDGRVRVSSIRALGNLKDPRAAERLLAKTGSRARARRGSHEDAEAPERAAFNANESLEVAAALGQILRGSANQPALVWLNKLHQRFGGSAPEVEIALARISPGAYLQSLGSGTAGRQNVQKTILLNWRTAASLAQALGEIANLPAASANQKELESQAEELLSAMLAYRNSGLKINTLVAVHSEYAVPEVLRAYAAFKPKNLGQVLRKQLQETDVIVRATAAELLGELPAEGDNTRALVAALPVALADQQLNDAALAILDSLAKLKSEQGNEAIKSALNSTDYLVRRKAVALLQANGVGDFSARIGTVQTRNTSADYERAMARIGKQFNATVTTANGSFTIGLLPDEAPLNVDNFIQLARRGYFNGIIIHRVVPNFVIQDGDPRGDGNGGPGYQIRCEINEVPYERGAVGMALSGKDTGGSQWFVTHSPQPHLDGGYTVFGHVTAGMNTVDNITRGDVIRSVVITEAIRRPTKRR